MKRNMEVKKNVDDMIYQVLNYISKSHLSDAEAETLVYEILSSIIMWNIEWDPENVDMKSVIEQINVMLAKLAVTIPAALLDNVNKLDYRETGE